MSLYFKKRFSSADTSQNTTITLLDEDCYKLETADDVISIIEDRPLLWIIGGDDKEELWSPALRERFGQELYETAKKLKAYIVTDGTSSACNRQVIEIVQEYDQMYDKKVELIAIVKTDTYRRRSDELKKYYRV